MNWPESSEASRATLPTLNKYLFAILLFCYYQRIPSTSVHFCSIHGKMKTFFQKMYSYLCRQLNPYVVLWNFCKCTFKHLISRAVRTIIVFVHWNLAKDAPLHHTQTHKYLSVCAEMNSIWSSCSWRIPVRRIPWVMWTIMAALINHIKGLAYG